MRRADKLTTFMCRLSRNLGSSTTWNPKDLSRPVMGLLYLLPEGMITLHGLLFRGVRQSESEDCPLTVVHSAASCSPSSLNTCTMKGRMLAMPENCCIIKYGTTNIRGRRVGGRSSSFHLSKLQCDDSSSFLS
jgi:hypothetical protein